MASRSEAKMQALAVQAVRDAVPGLRLDTRDPASGQGVADALLVANDGHGTASAPILMVVKSRLTPAALMQQISPQLELLRKEQFPEAAILIAAPWLSPRTQQVLNNLGYSYIDFTGNVSLQLDRPFVRVRLQGDIRDPDPVANPAGRRLSGAKAGRLVRALVDTEPPHTMSALAVRSGLSLSYVSRLATSLAADNLIQRNGRVIADVDWQQLLRARAAVFSFPNPEEARGFLAPQGPENLLADLAELAHAGQVFTLTGHYAATQIVPSAVGGQLMLYAPPEVASPEADLTGVIRRLGLLPAANAADVIIIRPQDSYVTAGRRIIDGVWHAAISQVTLDCLAGPGRLPAEGEELLLWMKKNLCRWRCHTAEVLAAA